MKATVSTDFLLRVAQATPEQVAQIERVLAGERLESGGGVWGGREGGAFEFRKTGRYWRVVFEGREAFPLEDTLGARYLDYLLHHANEAVAAFDLETAVQPEKGEVRQRGSVQAKLDGDSVRAYLRELGRLRDEREEAEKAGDQGEADRLDKDIEVLEEALRDGANTNSGDAGCRARDNVRKAIGSVRRNLARGGEAERAFGEHIERLVDMGYECIYNQPRGRIWE